MASDGHPQPASAIQRRAFIGSVARRAAYIAPAVLALKAARTTYAGPSGCGQTGSPCTTDLDCCTPTFTCQAGGMPCGTMMNCTCE